MQCSKPFICRKSMILLQHRVSWSFLMCSRSPLAVPLVPTWMSKKVWQLVPPGRPWKRPGLLQSPSEMLGNHIAWALRVMVTSSLSGYVHQFARVLSPARAPDPEPANSFGKSKAEWPQASCRGKEANVAVDSLWQKIVLESESHQDRRMAA